MLLRHRPWTWFAGAVLGLCAATSAQAIVTATAQIGRYTLSYFDANPSDGITPFLDLNQGYIYSTSQAYGNFGYTDAQQFVPGAYANSYAIVSAAVGETWARTTSTNATASFTLLYGAYTYARSEASSGASPLDARFRLTPWTVVTVSVPVHLAASTTIGYDGRYAESGEAVANMFLKVETASGIFETHESRGNVSASYSYDPVAGYGGESRVADGMLTLSYANLSASYATGYLTLVAGVDGKSQLPVPEPASALLLLAGCAGVCCFTRRRQGLP